MLGLGGGGLNALGRHTVAALLNSTSPSVDYTYTQAQVIQMFRAVYPGTNAQYEALKNIFAKENERGCDPKATPVAAGAVQSPGSFPNTGGPLGSSSSALTILAILGLALMAAGARWALRREPTSRS